MGKRFNEPHEASVRVITQGLIDLGLIKLIPSVLLLKSVGMARYMSRNVDHVHIPDALIQRLQTAGDKKSECVRVASELISALKTEGFSGVLLVTIGWEDMLPEILGGVRIGVIRAVKGVIIGQLLISIVGFGALFELYATTFLMHHFWAVLIVLFALAFSISEFLAFLERKVAYYAAKR